MEIKFRYNNGTELTLTVPEFSEESFQSMVDTLNEDAHYIMIGSTLVHMDNVDFVSFDKIEDVQDEPAPEAE